MQSTPRRFISLYCERCGFVRNFTKRGFEHRRHLAATILTCGLWGIPWTILAFQDSQRPWRCCMCGSRQMPKKGDAEPVPVTVEPPIRISPRRSVR
jgi:hypothetical protein